MKCTDKEWQHCQQEKRGCKGCYYETKIREKIDEVISYGLDNTIEVLQELLEEGK